MSDQIGDSMTVETIMQRIRERVRLRKQTRNGAAPPTRVLRSSSSQEPPTLELRNLTELRYKVAANNTFLNAVGKINPRPPGWHNDLIQQVKKGIRRLLTWYTRPLHQFNTSVADSLNDTVRALEDLQQKLSDVQTTRLAAAAALEERLGQLEQTTPARLEALQNQLIQQDERFRLSERSVRLLGHLIETRGSPLIPDEPEVRQKRARAKARKQPILDYFQFQERFRGNEAEIKRRQELYVPYFRSRKRVVDLGCGRGEFLELMRESGISAQGVELNQDMVLLAREKGLDVVQTDLFDYLVSLPPHSLDGIFCAQVVEHLTPEQLLDLIDLARLKLCPGSPLVLETINPACLTALARYFFQDLTHRQPIHPQALKFLLESKGFQPLELLYLAPVECSLPQREWPGLSTSEQAQFKRCIDILNEVIFGYQDYAAIGSLHTT